MFRISYLVVTLCVILFSVLFSGPAQSAFMTGKSLLALCNSADKDNIFACENYIAGVVDYHVLVRSLGTAPSVDFCLPANVKMNILTPLVTQYLAQRVEQQGFVAAPAVALAIYNRYPCPQRKTVKKK
jgi:hypothetical protein